MSGADWAAPAVDRPVDALVTVPGSKSLTNRHLVLATLAAEPTKLEHPLSSRDTLLMLAGVQALGVRATRYPDDFWWRLRPPDAPLGGASVDCGLAGTVMRFLPPVAALAQGPVAFHGDAQASARPMTPLLRALTSLGVRVDPVGGTALPFTVTGDGAVEGGEVEIDAATSSQFVSALLLSAPRFRTGLTLRHTGASLPSLPHIEMTVQVLRERGVRVDDSTPGQWRVEPGPIGGGDVPIEPDLSAAAVFLAAAAVTGGTVGIRGWPATTTQPGDRLPAILVAMGCASAWDGDVRSVSGPRPGGLQGIDVDLHDVGELTPVVAAVAALAATPSRLRGVAHLRGHETDRLQALATELNALGGPGVVEQTDDGLVIDPAPLHAGRFATYADHRMVMAGAVLGLRVPGLQVADPGTVAKTYPGFVDDWQAMLR